MSDNADRPAQESGGAGADDAFNVEDVDALLANVEELTSRVESEVGLPDAAGDPVAIAEQIAEDVAAIEQSVAESVAEAADVMRDESVGAEPPPPDEDSSPKVGSTAELVTAEDVAVADAEIFADDVPKPDAARAPETPPDSSVRGGSSAEAPNRVAGLPVSLLDRILEVIDRPFAAWSAERKALVGYVAIATLVMALVAWVLGVIVR